jgi:heptosyltransferase-2
MPASPRLSGADREERILVVAKPYIGDTVLAIPFLRNLRRAFPEARIDLCLEGAGSAVLADCPYVDGIIEWVRSAGRAPDTQGRLPGARIWAGIAGNARALRRTGYTRAYLLKDSLSAVLLAVCSRIPHRVGHDRDAGSWLLTRAVPVRRGRHQVELYLDLLRAEALPVDDGHNENWQSPAAASRVTAVLEALPAGRPRVFLAMQATRERRRWTRRLFHRRAVDKRQWMPANWAALTEWLVTERQCEVVLCGGLQDRSIHAELRTRVGTAMAAHVHELSTTLALRDLGPLLARMHVCIGVDTGPLHVAASFGTPIVKIVGGVDQQRWGPWGTRCAVLESAIARDISVADVVAKAALFLPPPRPPLETLDLRQGSFRYEVVSSPAHPTGTATPPPAALASAAKTTSNVRAASAKPVRGISSPRSRASKKA